MRHVSFTHWPVEKRGEIRSGQIDFNRNGFVFDQGTDTAEQIKTLRQRCANLRSVPFARDDCHFGIRTPRGRYGLAPDVASSAQRLGDASRQPSGAPAASAKLRWRKARRVEIGLFAL